MKNKDIGDFNFLDTIIDGEGKRITRRFLKEVSIKTVENCVRQMKIIGQSPIAYRERQLNPILVPALDNVSDAFLVESAVSREWSLMNNQMIEDNHGWVDYWCLYKYYNFYIELKHGFISYRNGKLRQSVKNDWQTACNQLDVLQSELNVQKEYAKGIFRITLQVLPIYIRTSEKEDVKIDINKINDIQTKAMIEISSSRPANWSCLWSVDESIRELYEIGDGYEMYPAVLFLGNISEITK